MNDNIDRGTLTKAVLRAADRLGLSAALPEILGMAAPAVDNMSKGQSMLDPSRDEWQAATRLVSLFRSLITLLGTAERARKWLDESHQTLGAAPSQLLRTHDGLERVLKYLDAVQKFEIKLPPRST